MRAAPARQGTRTLDPGMEGPLEHTEQDREEIRAAYARRRRNQLIATIPIGAVLLAFGFMGEGAAFTLLGLPQQVVTPMLVVLIVATLVFSFLNWRCPACSSYLGRAFNPKHCGNCGVNLRP